MNILQEAQGTSGATGEITDDLAWLPVVAPSQIDVLNMFRRDSTPLRVNIAGLDGHLLLADHGHPLVNPVAMPVAVGPWACRLVLPGETLKRLLQVSGVVRNATELAPLQRAILIEYVLTEQLNQLEAAIAQPVHIDWHDQVADFDIILPWVIDFDDFQCNAELHLTSDAARVLGRVRENSHSNDTAALASSIAFPIQLCAGTQELAVSELKHLRIGDVIMREEPFGTDPFAILSGRFFAPIKPDRNTYILDADWRSFNKSQESLMTSQTKFDTAGSADDLGQLEDLPVQLVFEIGRCELPLSELRKLGEGSVLPTAPSTTNAVNILANGRLVGNGELVKIGAGLGVRVLRLSKNG